MSRVVKLAVIPGDGIGPEVIAEAEKVLDAATAGTGIRFDKTRFSLGAARFLETGDTLTDADLEAIKGHDAILLGAVGGVPGDPRLKDANIERGLLLKLRFELDHYVNLRPSKLYPGAPGPLADPGEIDFVVVREGTEGPYVGNGGVDPPRHAARGRERDVRQHRLRRRARRALRVRPRRAPPQEAHARAQDQRARARRRHVAADRRRRGAGAPRSRRRLSARRRGDDLPGHEPVPLRRHRHRQPLRRHPDRPGRRRHRWHRPRSVGEHQPGWRVPVDVRARPRFGARHRGAAEGRPHGRDPLHRPPARSPRAARTKPHACHPRGRGRHRRPRRAPPAPPRRSATPSSRALQA